MQFFDMPFDPNLNLLPCDGEVYYRGRIFDFESSAQIFQRLRSSVHWKKDELIMFGKEITMNREVAWFADAGMSYTYSGKKKNAQVWNALLFEIKTKVEAIAQTTFNSCLLNYYHHGDEGMGWHSDDEPELVDRGVIASVSLGSTRKFSFRHKTNPELKEDIMLEDGSLLLMQGDCQRFWKHQLPKSKKITQPRINLTFRQIKG